MRKTFKILSLLMLFVLYYTTSAFAQDSYFAKQGKQTFTVSGGSFYDSGGRANYADNESDTIFFYPSNKSSKLTVNFTSFASEDGYDKLFIYYSMVNGKYLLDTYTGAYGTGRSITSPNPGEPLIFVFTSDDANNFAGWDATITMDGATVPACPALSYPKADSLNAPLNLTFGWSAVTGATSYSFIIGTDTVKNLTSTKYDYKTLNPGTTYNWKVLAINASGTSTGCSSRSLTTASVPTCISTVSPSNNATGVSISSYIEWSSVTNATSYDVYVGLTSANLIYVGNTTSTYYKATLNYGTTYYWKVVPKNAIGSASGCSVNSFSTITKPLTLTSQNGGQVYTAGDTIKINFTTSTSFADYFYAYLSTDGITYNTYLGYNYLTTAGNYTITAVLPNTLSSSKNCKIRLYPYYNPTYADTSDAAFSINAQPKYFNISSPDANTFINPGNYLSINWTSNYIGSVNIYYSLDNGSIWNSIGPSTSNTQSSFSWYIPTSITGNNTNCKIKISNADGVEKISPAFTISTSSPFSFGSIKDTLKPNTAYYIPVTNKATAQYKYMYYSLDNGGTWYSMGNKYFSNGENQIYWNVPSATTIYDKCLFRIDYSEPMVYSETFMLLPDPAITISKPASYSYVSWNKPYTIEFNSVLVNKVNIEYTLNNGTTWNSITSSYSVVNGANTYNWNVPEKTNYTGTPVLRISDASQTSIKAENYIYLSDPVKLSSPIAGQTYKVGDTLKINFYANQFTTYYIYLSYNNGTSWNYISSYYGSGNITTNYVIPYSSTLGDQCKLKVYNYYNPNDPFYSDISGAFSIVAGNPKIYSITSPNQGAFWKSNTTQYIYWNSYKVDTVDLLYSLDNGANWNIIKSGIASYENTTNSYAWTIPNTISGLYENSIIQVKAHASNIFINSPRITLSNQSPLVIASPLKGAKLKSGESNPIEIRNRGGYLSSTNYMYYSVDGGKNWTLLTYYYGLGSGSTYYYWTIPTTVASKNCRLIIGESLNNGAVSDSFVIEPVKAQISNISSPVANAYVKSGASVEVNWYSLSVAKVDISLSTDGGTNWTSIVAGQNAINGNNSYAWKVPSIDGGIAKNCLVKVAKSDSAALYAYSNYFVISNEDMYKITSPIKAQSFNAGDVLPINFKNNNRTTTSYLYLFYSNDSTNWSYTNAIYSVYPGANLYNWTIPSSLRTDSSFYIGISDNYTFTSSTNKSASQKIIINGLPPQITVKNPVAGDYYKSGTSVNLTWSSIHSSNVNIDYSIDKGASWLSVVKNANSYDSEQNSYSWSVPYVQKNVDSCFIRIQDVANTKVYDLSDNFTLGPKSQLRVTSPVLNDTVKAGSLMNINLYNYGKYIYNAYLYYSIDNGSLNSISTVYYIYPGARQYQWQLPSNLTESGKYRIISYEPTYGSYDTSAVFVVKGADPSIKVTSPVLNNVLWSKDNFSIYYNVVNVKTVDILYSTNGGEKWDTIAKSISANGYYNWTVPTITGTFTNCLIKVSGKSSLGATIQAISQAFTIKNEPISYTLIAPNGGEAYKAGDKVSIQFTNKGKSSYANLFYSLNNGEWTSITSVTANTGTNYATWGIPMDTKKSKAKIKVVDYYNNTIFDTSDTTFSIQIAAPYITLTNPYQNDLWISKKSYYVGYNSLNVTDAIVELSTDGGVNYTSLDTVASKYGFNSTYVNAPVVDTTKVNSILRVRSKTNNAVFATRVIVVSPSSPALKVVSPNGGEIYFAGNYIPVVVNNLGGSTYGTLYISYNKGISWDYYSNYYIYSGKNTFNIYTNTYFEGSAECLIKVVPNNLETHSQDVSDAVFTIKAIDPSIKVNTPYAGASYWSGDNLSINWYSVHASNVKISYSTDNKKNWTLIQPNNSSSNGSNYFDWVVPSITGKSDSCFVKVSSGDTVIGISNRFTIHNEASVITVIKPNGGEIYSAGNTISVQYYFSGRSRDYCDIYLSTDSGKTKKFVGKDDGVSNGYNYFNYFIPKESKTYKNCYLYVQEGVLENAAKDSSNAPFRINMIPPSITVTNPVQFDYLVSGNSYSVKWNSFKVSKAIIQYSIDGGQSWILLDSTQSAVNSIDGQNEFAFIAPKIKGTYNNCYIKVTSATNQVYSGISKVFTLSDVPAGYKLNYPNGGEIFEAGKSYTITFLKTGPKTYSSIKVELSTDGGNSYSLLGWASTSTLNGEYNWYVQETLAAKSCKIKISDENYTDESDAYFEIKAAPARINVFNPYASTSWQAGSKAYIGWGSLNVDKVNILITKDAGDTWKTLASNIYSANGNNNSFYLEVDTPSQNEYNCKIKVVSVADTNVFGVSSTFSIISIPASIALTSPNGGEVVKSGSSSFVNFDYTGAIADIAFAVSVDGGNSWQAINSIVAKPGKNTIIWYINQVPSKSCLVKVANLNGEVFDVSNSYFTIEDGYPSLEVTNPTSKSYYISGNTANIRWTFKNIKLVNIDYSLDAGTSWKNIVSNYSASSNNFDWTVPSIDKANQNVLVRVSNTDDASVYDLSEGFFVSNEARQLTVVYPNGGEKLKAGTDITVTINNNGPKSSATVKLFNSETTEYLKYNQALPNGTSKFEVRIPAYAFGGSDYKISVSDNYADIDDESDSLFSISGVKPVLEVTAPDSTNIWSKFETKTIGWKSYNVDSVKLEYTIDEGKTWILIDSLVQVSNFQNSYNWLIPDIKTAQKIAQIKVSKYGNNTVFGLSGKFKLSGTTPTLTLTNHNGGEKVKLGSIDTVKFNYTGDKQSIKIYLSTDSGKNYTFIESVYAYNGANKAAIEIPYDLAVSGKCLYRITDAIEAADTSNAVFSTIAPDPYIIIKEPVKGDYWVSKSVQKIKWSSYNVSRVNLQYSLDGGTYTNMRLKVLSWNNIENTYSFTVPDVVGHKKAVIKISGSTETSIVSLSDTFIITNIPAGFAFSYPTKGKEWQAGKSDTVRFEYNGKAGYANLYLSVDSGSTWTLLAEPYATMGKNTCITNLPITTSASSKAMLKLSLNNDNTIANTSEVFNVTAAPASIKVNAPAEKAFLISGTIASIEWESYSVNKVKIEYSLNNGTSWTSINDAVSSSNGKNSFNWEVVAAATPQKQSLIRITAVDNTTVSSKSAVFTIANKLPSINTKLVEIKLDGTALANFSNDVKDYNYKIPFGSTTVPVVTAKAEDANASVKIVNTTWFPGSTTVTVTAEDGIAVREFSISYSKAEASKDTTLSGIKVNGTAIAGFASTKAKYIVNLPAGTAQVPVLDATPTNKYAKVTYLNAEKVPGTSKITVIAEDGKTKGTYVIEFTVGTEVHNLAGVEIELYPNPVREKLYIKNAGEANVYLYNYSGQLVQSVANINNEAELNVSSATPGLYFVKIVKGNETVTQKIEILK